MSTESLIIVLASLLFLSGIFNIILIVQLLKWICIAHEDNRDDLDDIPNCKCDDVNHCDIYCIAKHNFYNNHP